MYLDTHILVWLYVGTRELFSDTAVSLIEEHDLRVSPVVLLELEYLREINRLRADADVVLAELNRTVGLTVCPCGFHDVVAYARRQNWTRDPFDRLIVGQAACGNAPLLTRDATILANYPRAVW